MKKKCSKCGELKASHEFYGVGNSSVCRQCISENNKFKRLMDELCLDHNKPYLIVDEYKDMRKERDKFKELSRGLYKQLKKIQNN